MHISTPLRSRTLLCAPLCATLLLSLSACSKDKKPESATTQAAQTSAETAKAPTQQAKGVQGVLDGETYELFYPQQEGAPISVRPKPGFKVNKDFPHRLKLKGAEVTGEIKPEQLEFAIASATASCEGSCEGSADFSICNDQMCKLYRDVKLSWEVSAKSSEAAPTPAPTPTTETAPAPATETTEAP